jgi:hypothetical protein
MAVVEEDASERPEDLWKEFLQGIAPLIRDSSSLDGRSAPGGEGMMVTINKQAMFRQISQTACKLTAWIQDRIVLKGQEYTQQIVILDKKLLGAEQDGKYLDGLLVACHDSTKRRAFQCVVADRRECALMYKVTALSRKWDVAMSMCMQKEYDTESKVQVEMNSGICLLKGELSKVRGNLYSDCQTYEGKMNTAMVDICHEEKAAVGGAVRRKFQVKFLKCLNNQRSYSLANEYQADFSKL